MLTLRLRCACAAAAAAAAALAPPCVLAGAWTKPPGEGFSSQELRYFETDEGDDRRFAEAGVSIYLELGLVEGMTAGFTIEQNVRTDDNGFGAQSGRVGGFLRERLWRSDAGSVASAEIGGAIPLSGFQTAAAPNADESAEIRGALLYGRGFATEWGNGWVDGSLGFSHFTGGRASEIGLDLTAGLKPDEDWVAMAQVFATIGLRDERSIADTDYDLVKARLSVGRRIFGDVTLLVGVSRDVHTRDTSPGWEATLTIWRPFTLDFGLSE